MNKKNKGLLTSVGLAVLSGIAATGSTFAWFTTTRTATISYSSATVVSKQSNLQVTYVSSSNTWSTVPSTEATNSLTLLGGNEVTDISGDGIDFYKPVWSAVEDQASSIGVVSTVEGFYIDFTVAVSIDNDSSMNVYLGENTAITAVSAGDPKDQKAVLASRMAVLDASEENVLLTYAPSDTTHQYITAGATGVDSLYGIDGFTTATTDSLNGFTTYTTQAQATADDDSVVLATLSSGTPSADLTFRAWIEGEDLDAVNAAIGGIFNIDIELYGLAA